MLDINVDIPAEILCAKCGKKALATDSTEDDDSIVTCSACGIRIGRWGDVKQAALESVMKQLKHKFKDEFGDAFHPA